MNLATAFHKPAFQTMNPVGPKLPTNRYRVNPIPPATTNYHQKRKASISPKTELLRLTNAPDKPPLLSSVLDLLTRHGFKETDIEIGLTGHGKTKVYLAEIGLVSTSRGFYNLHIGGSTAENTL